MGGRSTGARVACRTAAAVGAAALLLLAFPLRPPTARKDPGRAEAAAAVRLAEWASAGPRPVVLVQGERDPFGPDRTSSRRSSITSCRRRSSSRSPEPTTA